MLQGRNISFFLAKEVAAICHPLFLRYNLSAFAYSRVFPDGSRAELWSNPYALEHTFLTKKYISGLYTPDLYSKDDRYLVLKDKIETYSGDLRRRYTQQLADQRNIFNHDHSFMILNKRDELCEYFIFYAPKNAKSVINFYLNNTANLNAFVDQFKQEASKLITQADANKMVLPWRTKERSLCLELSCAITTQKRLLALRQYKEKNSLRLTEREYQVACLVIQGNTAKEMGKLLKLSFRTVESYLENLKIKLGCFKKTELVAKLIAGKFCEVDS